MSFFEEVINLNQNLIENVNFLDHDLAFQPNIYNIIFTSSFVQSTPFWSFTTLKNSSGVRLPLPFIIENIIHLKREKKIITYFVIISLKKQTFMIKFSTTAGNFFNQSLLLSFALT